MYMYHPWHALRGFWYKAEYYGGWGAMFVKYLMEFSFAQ